MNRRYIKLLSLWIVPLLIARSMIPAGYMLSTADGLQLMFCPAVVETIREAGMAHSGHAGHQGAMQHAGHDGGPADNSHENAPCPFSLAASAALLDVPFLPAVSNPSVDETVEFISAPVFTAGLLRADRIRGPPQFS